MRKIKYIVIHCTATDLDVEVSSIQNYWKTHLGWKNPGYHFIIEEDGNIVKLQDIDKLANGVRGYNSNSIHISWIGGKDVDNRTDAQKESLKELVKYIHIIFPEAEIKGHRDFPGVAKDCPQFDAMTEYKDI